jgi:glycosyltransferase involved in cell wall biosynthesis
MNVGYVYGFNSYPPRDGGTIHVYNLVRELSALGCTVHTLGDDDNPLCTAYPRTDGGVRRFLEGIELLCMRIDRRMLHTDAVRRRVLSEFTSGPIVWEINAPAEEALSRYSHAPSGAVPLGTASLRAWGSKRLAGWRIAREEACRRNYASLVAAAICVSTAMGPYASGALGIQRCVVIPNGSDPELFAPDKSDDPPFKGYDDHFKVIYSGDFRWPWQGFDLIQRLAARARADGRKVLFVVLNNSPAPSVASRANVLVFDRVPYRDVPRYLAASDACLCLYRDFTWSRYGFYLSPLKLYDYMAAGRPVIASRLGQMAEAIEDGRDGLLATSDPEDIYAKLVFCVEHRNAARRMGEAAREKVVRFYNWRRAAAATLDLFRSLARQDDARMRVSASS